MLPFRYFNFLINFCQQYLKKLHMQERAIEEVKLAIKPFYQRRDINKEEYKEILRKAVEKVGFHVDRLFALPFDVHPLSPLRMVYAVTLCSRSSGVPQQERRDKPGEGGESGEGVRG